MTRFADLTRGGRIKRVACDFPLTEKDLGKKDLLGVQDGIRTGRVDFSVAGDVNYPEVCVRACAQHQTS